MKLSFPEEYGLRCLLRVATLSDSGYLTINEISEDEGLSASYVAKLMRILRQNGFVKSVRGQVGGYALARPADKIIVGEVLAALGGRLFDPRFCTEHSGLEVSCKKLRECSIRTLWRTIQILVDQVLSKVTLADLVQNSESEMVTHVSTLVQLEAHTNLEIRSSKIETRKSKFEN
jgi:Rrf2 family transcriptional regulator, iron-sulfur cluster assembly transcription factor